MYFSFFLCWSSCLNPFPILATSIFFCLFVAVSHQTGLDTRSKAWRPIKVGIKGGGDRERADTRTLLVYAAHRLTWCNMSLLSQVVSRTQMCVWARMPSSIFFWISPFCFILAWITWRFNLLSSWRSSRGSFSVLCFNWYLHGSLCDMQTFVWVQPSETSFPVFCDA